MVLTRGSNFATRCRRVQVQVQRNLRRASASRVTTCAAIYLRISLDAAMNGLAIERQREDCKAIAKQRGWTVVHTYVDQSISASKKDVERPDYDAMVASLKRGELDAIIC